MWRHLRPVSHNFPQEVWEQGIHFSFHSFDNTMELDHFRTRLGQGCSYVPADKAKSCLKLIFTYFYSTAMCCNAITRSRWNTGRFIYPTDLSVLKQLWRNSIQCELGCITRACTHDVEHVLKEVTINFKVQFLTSLQILPREHEFSWSYVI